MNANRTTAKEELLTALHGEAPGDTLEEAQAKLRTRGGMALAIDRKRGSVQLHHVTLGESFSFELGDDMTFSGLFQKLTLERP